jgi:hypothetical protein
LNKQPELITKFINPHKTPLNMPSKTNAMKVVSATDHPNGITDVVVESEGHRSGYRLHTFPPEVGRALPTAVESARRRLQQNQFIFSADEMHALRRHRRSRMVRRRDMGIVSVLASEGYMLHNTSEGTAEITYSGKMYYEADRKERGIMGRFL